jgi:hypothetical protein
MHACLFYIYDNVLFLFILFVVYYQKSVMIMREQPYLNKDRSFVMLTSSIRLCPVLYFKSSRMMFELLADSLS